MKAVSQCGKSVFTILKISLASAQMENMNAERLPSSFS